MHSCSPILLVFGGIRQAASGAAHLAGEGGVQQLLESSLLQYFHWGSSAGEGAATIRSAKKE